MTEEMDSRFRGNDIKESGNDGKETALVMTEEILFFLIIFYLFLTYTITTDINQYIVSSIKIINHKIFNKQLIKLYNTCI